MSVAKMSWSEFVESAPDRVKDVIENGPFPLTEYGSSKITRRDKRMGIMRYKGTHSMKRGGAAIVYFDPDFCEGEFILSDTPDDVTDQHSDTNVKTEFTKL